MNFNIRDETVRGYLLLGVFFIHALYDATYYMDDWQQAPVSFALIKLLAPYISIYFLLSGMSARNLKKKSFRSILPQSLMLIFTAWVSEGVAIVVRNLLYGGYGYGLQFIKAAFKPIIYGTGGCDYITWFFTTLAVARILAWVFERNKIYFVLCWLVIAGLVVLSKCLHLPDNLYEWRNWPMATLFVAAGMHLPKNLRVPRGVGLGALVVSVVLVWFDAPGMWTSRPCLTCHMDFAAEPMVGSYGSLPVFIVAVSLGLLFMLWAAQASYPTPLGKVGRYFGRASLQFLLLHGWLLVTIEPLIALYAPRRPNIFENLLLLLAFLLLLPVLHAVVFQYTVKYLNKVLASCFEYGRLVTECCYRWAGAPAVAARRPADG